MALSFFVREMLCEQNIFTRIHHSLYHLLFLSSLYSATPSSLACSATLSFSSSPTTSVVLIGRFHLLSSVFSEKCPNFPSRQESGENPPSPRAAA
ncbi:hypothetical protein QL285_086136 [Trifolium repens]|nr:hypothetical protein QL285_086136 [Trifolium repens]